ncbi:hypothetical protein [Halobacteriovorax sp. DPLXC-1]|uniref:hypothetical protein n=1 Tax=Halobacteriovorax sp. DPLXC-1 TaxID=3110771 RepID=UPI002FF25A5F
MNISMNIILKDEIMNSSVKSFSINEAFKLYMDVWKNIFTEYEVFPSDSLLRQDIHILLYHEMKPIGYCAMSKYDYTLLAYRHHSFFTNMPNEVLETLTQLELQKTWSVELLTVHPNFRQGHFEIDVYEGLKQVLMNIIRDLQAEHVIAPIVKTNQASLKGRVHGEIIIQNIIYKSLFCDFLHMNYKTVPDIEDEKLAKAINSLYQPFKEKIKSLSDKEKIYEQAKKIS